MKNTTDTQVSPDGSGNLFDKEAIRRQTDAFLAWETLRNYVAFCPEPMTEDEIEEYCGMRQQHVNRMFQNVQRRNGVKQV